MKKTIFSIVVIIFSVGMIILALETVVRVRHWVNYGSPTTLQVFVRDENTGLRIPKASSKNGNIIVNSLGFRGPEISFIKSSETFRLAFLGGSTTWCAEVSRNEATWPHLVYAALQREIPARTFDYVNAGIPGYSTEESLTNLLTRVQQTHPDLIFIYHGINDLSYDTRKMAKAQGVFSGKPENPSWLSEYSMAWFLLEKNLQLMFRKQQVIAGSQLLQFEPSELSRDFRKRLTLLIQKSKQVAPLVGIATFSYQYRREQSREEQFLAAESSIFYMPYMDVQHLLQGLEEYNQVIRQVARKEGIILIEGENDIPGDPAHFNDSVHFKDPGSEKMAERVVNGFLNSPAFLRMAERHEEGVRRAHSSFQVATN